MALIKDYYNPQFNLTVAGCYWKIEVDNGIQGGKEKLNVRMNCFKTKEIADTNQDKYMDFDFQFTPDLTDTAPNFIAQAYTFVKTLPEFTTAVDA